MTDKPVENQEQRQADMAPETHNDEQDDHLAQAQEVSEEAQALTPGSESPTESERDQGDSGLLNDSTQDMVDHMRDMESSGRVDMDAYRGEPNYDDNVDKYGEGHNSDGLRGDGS
ncbi:hypothetical protein D6851_10715 [Altericroceibacterium spongiae]|uniref:Uncharacterized protein n=1 Tax=Altericroceibacterium spongiae TaxID=2320269 RepID=A0A420EIW2_9SPHN|nr:hypothetical protein [Altericroceibacterium spongiae]RKF20604.1 hypothetical protein D6851_10715 [Altericroceibacterium spongiae]